MCDGSAQRWHRQTNGEEGRTGEARRKGRLAFSMSGVVIFGCEGGSPEVIVTAGEEGGVRTIQSKRVKRREANA
jgi:hypothetical protein